MAKSFTNLVVKKTAVIVLGILLLLLLAVSGVEYWFESRIRRLIEKELSVKTGGVYRAEVGKVNVNLWMRSVTVGDIALSSDSAAFARKSGRYNIRSAKIESLTASGIKLRNRKNGRELYLRRMIVDSPSAVVEYHNAEVHGDTPKGGTLRQRITDDFRVIAIRHVQIDNGRLEYADLNKNVPSTYLFDDFTIRADNFRIDTSENARFFFSDDLQTKLAKFSSKYDHGSMQIDLNSVEIGTRAGKITIGKIDMIPRYPRDIFAKLHPRHADWTQLKSGAIELSGIDFKKFITDNIIDIDSVVIHNTDIHTYKNRQIAQRPKVKNLFQTMLHRLPVKLRVREVVVSNANVRYDELAENGNIPGFVTFDSIYGNFYGMSNIPSKAYPYFKLIAACKVMNSGKLNASFNFPVDSVNTGNRFNVEGTLGETDLTRLNSMILPLMNIQITGGQIDSMRFRIEGDPIGSNVNLRLYYRNISLELVREKDKQFEERIFLSWIINKWVIKKSNPDKDGFRPGSGSFRRDPYRSQFNYLWKSLLPGVTKSITGIGNDGNKKNNAPLFSKRSEQPLKALGRNQKSRHYSTL